MLLQTIYCVLTNATLYIGANVAVSMNFFCNTHFGIQDIINITKFKKLFSGFDLTTPHSFFTILVEVFTNHILAKKHIFHESYRVNKTQDYEIANKYQINRQFYHFKNIFINDSQHHPFLS